MKKQGPVTERSVPSFLPVSADPEAGNISILPGTSEGRTALVAKKMVCFIRTPGESYMGIPTPVSSC